MNTRKVSPILRNFQTREFFAYEGPQWVECVYCGEQREFTRGEFGRWFYWSHTNYCAPEHPHNPNSIMVWLCDDCSECNDAKCIGSYKPVCETHLFVQDVITALVENWVDQNPKTVESRYGEYSPDFVCTTLHLSDEYLFYRWLKERSVTIHPHVSVMMETRTDFVMRDENGIYVNCSDDEYEAIIAEHGGE